MREAADILRATWTTVNTKQICIQECVGDSEVTNMRYTIYTKTTSNNIMRYNYLCGGATKNFVL